eukprot:scaffold2848_cov352-Pavlova_lutheri.AAC.2
MVLGTHGPGRTAVLERGPSSPSGCQGHRAHGTAKNGRDPTTAGRVPSPGPAGGHGPPSDLLPPNAGTPRGPHPGRRGRGGRRSLSRCEGSRSTAQGRTAGLRGRGPARAVELVAGPLPARVDAFVRRTFLGISFFERKRTPGKPAQRRGPRDQQGNAR